VSIRVVLPKKLAGIPLSNTRLMRSIGTAIVGRIRARTQSGRDVDGRPFRALSPGYRRQKQKHLGSGAADLTVSGQMLNSMLAKPSPTSVRIAFAGGGTAGGGRGRTFIQRSRSVGAADKAFFHNESGAGRSRVLRKFFGLSDEDETLILSQVGAFIARQIR